MTFWLLLPVGAWLLISLVGALSALPLVLMRFKPLNTEAAASLHDQPAPQVITQWLAPHGFQPDGAVKGITTILGWSDGRGRYVGFYELAGQVVIDLQTEWGDGVSLNTGTTSDNGMLPVPRGTYKQSVPPGLTDRHALWAAHHAAEDAVEQAEGVRLSTRVSNAPSFPEYFPDTALHEAAYMLSRPWLWLTLPWRYFVTKRRLKGVPVSEQIKSGYAQPRHGRGFPVR